MGYVNPRRARGNSADMNTLRTYQRGVSQQSAAIGARTPPATLKKPLLEPARPHTMPVPGNARTPDVAKRPTGEPKIYISLPPPVIPGVDTAEAMGTVAKKIPAVADQIG